jgi:CubicO group peptidase (beta-lactamase class C family)
MNAETGGLTRMGRADPHRPFPSLPVSSYRLFSVANARKHRKTGTMTHLPRCPPPRNDRPRSANLTRLSWHACLMLLAACGGGLRAPHPVDLHPALESADSLVALAVDTRVIPGAVILVARNGEVLLHRAHGFAQAMELPAATARQEDSTNPYIVAPQPVTKPRPMTPSTVFDLASVTKVMATTMALMLLVDRGEVALDAPVHDYLPEFRGISKDSITVRHLLTHSAGLAQWQPIYYSATNSVESYRTIREMPLEWGVGEARHYSDLGFMLLGYLVERVTGVPLDRFVAEELYEPLGLEQTGFRRTGCSDCPQGPFAATSHGNPYEYRMVHDTSFGYTYSGDPNSWNGWRRYTLVGEVNDGNAFYAHGGVAGHAGLFSSATELARLLELLLNGGELEGRRFVSPETVAIFLKPTEYGQALGWQTPSWAPPGSFAHTGFTGTFVIGIPSERLALVLLTNRQNFGVGSDTRYPDIGELQREVVETVLGVDR